MALITSPAPDAMYTVLGEVVVTPVIGFLNPAGTEAQLIEPQATPTAMAITPTSRDFMLNCMAIAKPINIGINDENNVKIALRSTAQPMPLCTNGRITYFKTADGKTPIKIP